MELIKKNRLIFWVTAVVILVLVLVLPVRLPHNISTYGKIYPQKEWVVFKGPDGRLLTTLVNNSTGISENYSVTQFERGDAVEFRIDKKIRAGYPITQNDTVAVIFSNKTESELTDLKADLAAETALLEVNLSEEKESVINREKQRLEYAKRQLEEQQKLFRRQKALFEKDLISEEEFDLAKGAVDLFKINVEIAEERVQTVSTGSKTEEVNYIRSRIEGLKNRINILEQKFSDFVIQSPIDGVIRRTYSADTLLIVSDTSNFVLLSPIQPKDEIFIKNNQKILFEIPNHGKTFSALIKNIEPSARNISGESFYIVNANVIDKSPKLIPGLSVECTVETEALYPREYLSNFISGLVN